MTRHGTAVKLAYVMSRFPKLTETFVLFELETLDALGVPVELYPLLRERQEVAHPEAERWVRRARYHPFVSLPILRAQLHYIRRQPLRYLKVLAEVLAGTWGSANFFLGAIGIFPKSVRFAYEMSRRGVTHVHAHFANHPAVAALIVHRLTGIPYSFTAHGSDLHVERRMLDRKVEASAFAVTVSRYNRALMLAECGERFRDGIHVVHCGVDTRFFRPPEDGAAEDPFRILCVASFEDVKGHRYLVEACRLLSGRGVDFRCDLVGDGPLRSDVEARIREAGLADRVRLHGPEPRLRVAERMRRAHVAVLPSHRTPRGKREGIPVVLMEAMASGLPVVASDISGIPELVDHERTGFLVPPRDPAALAASLERLQRDPGLRTRLGKAARRKVMREFDVRANTRKLVGLFLDRDATAAASAAGGPFSRAGSVPSESGGRDDHAANGGRPLVSDVSGGRPGAERRTAPGAGRHRGNAHL